MNTIITKIISALFLLSACASTKSTVPDDGFLMNEVTLEDSIIYKYFKSYYPDIELKDEIAKVKGKTVQLTNYYKYYSFKKKIGDTDSVTVINFGSYASHTKSFMLLTYKSQARKEDFFFGGSSYNEELLSLNDFFKSLGGKLTEEPKIIITDLFLRCRRGQAQTPIYVKW